MQSGEGYRRNFFFQLPPKSKISSKVKMNKVLFAPPRGRAKEATPMADISMEKLDIFSYFQKKDWIL